VKGTDADDKASTPVSHSFVTVEPMALDALGLELARVRCPPPRRVETIRRDLATNGQLTPLVARLQPGELPWLLDGFKRLRAAQELGWSHLEVGLIEASASTALALMLSLNRRFGLSQFEEALVVRELTRSGLTGVEVGVVLTRHKSWVSRRLGLVERLAPELQEEMKLGLMEAGMARRLLGLPRGNQVELAAVARKAALGVKQTETLVQLWRRAPSDQARQFVLTHPSEAIEATLSPPPQRAQDPRLSAQGQSVQRRLHAVLSAMTALTEALGSGLQAQDHKLLEQDLEALSRLMARMRCRLGPNDAGESSGATSATSATSGSVSCAAKASPTRASPAI
jgi:ParB-like chromosome segregation protein Spo0J